MNEVTWITDEEQFDDIISLNETVVLDLTAPSWCNPCRQFAPHFEKAAELSGDAFVAIDVDEAPWAMVRFGVRGVPTVKQFIGGEYVRDLKERTVVKLINEINSN